MRGLPLPLSEPSADRKRGMPVLHFLTILYEDDHDLLCRLIRHQNIRLPLKGDLAHTFFPIS
jgi:hypothetical protein